MSEPEDANAKRLRAAAGCWDATAAVREDNPIQGWLDSPLVLEAYVQPKLGGSARVNWLLGTVERLRIPKTGRWLSLGCGSAGQEIAAAEWGLFASMLALDASPASLEIARQSAQARGVTTIQFDSTDLDRVSLPADSFDVVLMNMSLHHVRELRHVLGKVRESLRNDGFFIINEYVGPRQFQFSPLQLDLVRELLETLPEKYRRDSISGGIKREYVRMPVEHWNVADPSEAIRSDRIVAEIEKQFRVVERNDYGGTILNLLLEHIVHNFHPGDEKDVAIVQLLAKFEDILIRQGVLASDFTVMAMKKPAGILGRLRQGIARF